MAAMPNKPGRDLEELVARFETRLSPLGVMVKSPDRIRGLRSNSLREVDISLRGRVGSADLLVIVECRERTRVQDVNWIEQIATKMKDVGAAKAIAVSSSAFSEPATRLANAEGVDLRTVTSLDVDEYREMFKPVPVFSIKHHSRFEGVQLGIAEEHKSQLAALDDSYVNVLRNRLAKVYRWQGSDDLVSLMDVWLASSSGLFEAYRDIPHGSRVTLPIRFNLMTPLILSTPVGELRIDSIDFLAELWSEVSELSPKEVREYRSQVEVLGQASTYEFEYRSGRGNVSIERTGSTGPQEIVITAEGIDVERRFIVVEPDDPIAFGHL